MEEMEKMVQQVTKGLGLIGILPLIGFIFFGDFVLSFWGEEFSNGYWALLIMSVGQFFNIATGAAGSMLNMCGFEKEQRNISIISAVFNLLANYFLIKNYGLLGAAVATAVTTIGQNIARLLIAKNKVGISTIALFK